MPLLPRTSLVYAAASPHKRKGVVDKLEDGELPLEQALTEFERGVALSRRCGEELDAADRRIEILIEQSGGHEAQAFDLDEAGEDHSPDEGAF